MKYLFRFDFGLHHGLGHLYRCMHLIQSSPEPTNCVICTEANSFSTSYFSESNHIVFWKNLQQSEESFITDLSSFYPNSTIFVDTLLEYSPIFIKNLTTTIKVFFSIIIQKVPSTVLLSSFLLPIYLTLFLKNTTASIKVPFFTDLITLSYLLRLLIH